MDQGEDKRTHPNFWCFVIPIHFSCVAYRWKVWMYRWEHCGGACEIDQRIDGLVISWVLVRRVVDRWRLCRQRVSCALSIIWPAVIRCTVLHTSTTTNAPPPSLRWSAGRPFYCWKILHDAVVIHLCFMCVFYLIFCVVCLCLSVSQSVSYCLCSMGF